MDMTTKQMQETAEHFRDQGAAQVSFATAEGSTVITVHWSDPFEADDHDTDDEDDASDEEMRADFLEHLLGDPEGDADDFDDEDEPAEPLVTGDLYDDVMEQISAKPIEVLQHMVHQLAQAKGFWEEQLPLIEEDDAEIPEDAVPVVLAKIALIHSELSEATEEVRQGRLYWETDSTAAIAKPEGVGAELADALIRILDLATALGIDLGALVARKHLYNSGRPYRHGKLA